MAIKPDIQQEEVDLGTLFSQIGKMFSNFFNFIGRIFKSIFHYLIILILFVRKNIIVLGVGALTGVVLGIILDINKKPVYGSEMSLELAYGSGNNLYSQVDYLNALISNADSIKIGDIFSITSSEAASILAFNAEPINSEKDSYLAYDSYMQRTDTIYTREFEYEDFMKRIEDNDLRNHEVSVLGLKPHVFVKLNDNFKYLIENEYYKSLKDRKIDELLFEKEKIKNNLSQIDSLRKRYKETAYMQFEQKDEENSGVSFRTINAGYRGNVDMDLYHQSDSLFGKLRKINQLVIENEEIVKIQSSFSEGREKTSLLSKGWLRYGFLGFLIVFLALSAIQFNRYLNNYEKH